MILINNLALLYRNHHASQNDLVKRLRNVVEQLQDPAVEPNSPDFPGLGSLSNTLVADQYINHRDKDVRLHTVLACMEIFAVVSQLVGFAYAM